MSTAPATATSATRQATTKPAWRWYQFSLQTMLISLLLISIFFGGFAWRLQRARRQANAVATIRAQGGSVSYDYAMTKNGNGMYEVRPGATVSPVPTFLRELCGEDFFHEVYAVHHAGDAPANQQEMIAAWDAIGTFSHLKVLQLNGMGWPTRGTSHSPGIKNLAKTPELQHLLINYGRVDVQDLKVIGGLVHLQELKPWGLDFDDSALEGLAGLQELRVLDIQSSEWSLRGVVAISKLQNLEELQVRSGSVGDDKMEPLQSLSKLQWLNVQGSEVTSAGAATLKQKLPACQVLISPPKGK